MATDNAPFGVLLINLGTPDAPTPKSIRKFLKPFLWDIRVIDTPRPIWWLILNLIILPIRPRVIAKNYESIWTEGGSPLLVYSKQQQTALALLLQQQLNQDVPVAIGMTYGNPSINEGIQQLQDRGVDHIVILPLYPQYSATTTGAGFDAVAKALKTEPNIPELSFIRHYYKKDAYIQALSNSIKAYWQQHGTPDTLLFSFHGIPERYQRQGDPYPEECKETARLTVKALGLNDDQWSLSFQSRVGREEWVKPYTDKTLVELAQQNGRRVDVVCPAFSVDCLETLEEIDQENRHTYLDAGGKEYHYIPCLNATQEHIQVFAELIRNRLGNNR